MKLMLVRKRPGILIFLLLAAMSTIIAFAVFAGVQQTYRSNANDPQIEAVQTIASVLGQGVPPEAITGQGDTVDIENSLSLFVSIYDKDGKLASSSGKLGEDSPTPPSGIFEYLRKNDKQRFTWEPKKGVRIAAVAEKLEDDKGFVLVGRNMKEIDMRIQNSLIIVGAAWISLLVLSLLLSLVLSMKPVQEEEVTKAHSENS